METKDLIEKEIKSLQQEFLDLGKEIKNCKDSATRKILMEEKKQIQLDIEEAKKHLEVLEQLSEANEQENNVVEEAEDFKDGGEDCEFPVRVTESDNSNQI
jgi:hypothetical protein